MDTPGKMPETSGRDRRDEPRAVERSGKGGGGPGEGLVELRSAVLRSMSHQEANGVLRMEKAAAKINWIPYMSVLKDYHA
ncbi:hypothetical protein GNI_150390, partial [Gregarina niphandrodes]